MSKTVKNYINKYVTVGVWVCEMHPIIIIEDESAEEEEDRYEEDGYKDEIVSKWNVDFDENCYIDTKTGEEYENFYDMVEDISEKVLDS
jgi:hypothetical protein